MKPVNLPSINIKKLKLKHKPLVGSLFFCFLFSYTNGHCSVQIFIISVKICLHLIVVLNLLLQSKIKIYFVVAAVRSREGSPRMPRPRSEEIPLEDIISSQEGNVAGAVPQLDPTLPSSSNAATAKVCLNNKTFCISLTRILCHK